MFQFLIDGLAISHGQTGKALQADKVSVLFCCSSRTPTDVSFPEFEGRASLACASVDGSIRLLKVTQFAQDSASTTAFYPVYQVGQTLEPEEARICDPDGKGVTGLRWIEDVTKRVSFSTGEYFCNMLP